MQNDGNGIEQAKIEREAKNTLATLLWAAALVALLGRIGTPNIAGNVQEANNAWELLQALGRIALWYGLVVLGTGWFLFLGEEVWKGILVPGFTVLYKKWFAWTDLSDEKQKHPKLAGVFIWGFPFLYVAFVLWISIGWVDWFCRAWASGN